MIRLPITVELAQRILNNGMLLPVNREYANSRVKEIALRQKELMDEFNKLEEEIYKMQIFEDKEIK